VTPAELTYALSQTVQALIFALWLSFVVVGLRVMWGRRWV
jgi:hypothetical protein